MNLNIMFKCLRNWKKIKSVEIEKKFEKKKQKAIIQIFCNVYLYMY